jgi:hypothetical protein
MSPILFVSPPFAGHANLPRISPVGANAAGNQIRSETQLFLGGDPMRQSLHSVHASPRSPSKRTMEAQHYSREAWHQ